MTPGNSPGSDSFGSEIADASQRPVFDATITPHRSLGQNGFRIVMTLVCLASVISSLPFVLLGAWPVAGFFGLDFLGLYIAFTLIFTDWRLRFRRAMNATDQEANTKAIDSLLNYETVKYFGNEKHEERRYDATLARYEQAYTRSEVTLNYLNMGQAAIIAVGLTVVMLMAARGAARGEMTVGDFVLVNTYLIQLYLPLNFLGFVPPQKLDRNAEGDLVLPHIRFDRALDFLIGDRLA